MSLVHMLLDRQGFYPTHLHNDWNRFFQWFQARKFAIYHVTQEEIH